MRKMFSAVAFGAVALLASACSSDTTGLDLGPQYGAGFYQHSTQSAPAEVEGNLSQCGWDALRRADGQTVEKGACKLVENSQKNDN